MSLLLLTNSNRYILLCERGESNLVREMVRGNHNLGVGGARRGSGGGRSVSGGERGGTGGGTAGGSGGRCGNNYQQFNQSQSGGGGYDGKGGRRGGRGGTKMGTNPPPAQPRGYRPVQGGTQRPESGMGQAAGATGRRGAWSSGPPRVAGRGWASAVGGRAGVGAGAGTDQAQSHRTDHVPVPDFPVAFNSQSTILHCNVDAPRASDGDAVSSFSVIIDISKIIDMFICCFI